MAVAKITKKTRKEIRKAVVDLLKNKTLAGAKIFPNYSVPPAEEELPVILVYPRSEPVTLYAESPREFTFKLDLTIEIVAAGPEVDEEGNLPETALGKQSLEDILDDISEQVLCEMARDETLRCTADDSFLTNVEFEFEGGGGQPIGSCRMTYEVSYNRMVPESADKQLGKLDDFEGANVDYDLIESEPDTIEAEDAIDVPTS